MNFNEYKEIDAINSSTLKNYLQDNTTRLNIDNTEKYTERNNALRVGTNTHAWILEKNKPFIFPPLNLRTKNDKLTLHKLLQKHTDFLYHEEAVTIEPQINAVPKKGAGAELFWALHKQNVEDTIVIDAKPICDHPEVKKFKCRPDVWGEFEGEIWIGDYKTCVSANPYDIVRDIKKFHYDLQAMFYKLVLATKINRPVSGFVFLFQEKKAPYLSTYAKIHADSEIFDSGHDKIEKSLDNLINKRNENFYDGSLLNIDDFLKKG